MTDKTLMHTFTEPQNGIWRCLQIAIQHCAEECKNGMWHVHVASTSESRLINMHCKLMQHAAMMHSQRYVLLIV